MNQPPADWHRDPFSRFEYRYWDGTSWTDAVATAGQTYSDPPVESSPSSSTPTHIVQPMQTTPPARATGSPSRRAQAHAAQFSQTFTGTALTGSPIVTETVLVVSQRGKLVELRAEYDIYDQAGTRIAVARGKRMTNRIDVLATSGHVLMTLRREAALRSRITVTDGAGRRLGRIMPARWRQTARDFNLEGPGEVHLAAVLCDEVRTTNRRRHERYRKREFAVQDPDGDVLAEISKARAGFIKERFTKADDYVLGFSAVVPEALRALSLAVVLVIDTRFHQQ